MTDLPQPYLLFLGDNTEPTYAKTALGLRYWAAERCIGECASDADAMTIGLARMNPAEAAAQGARALVIGIANPGGIIPGNWLPTLLAALEAGLDIVSGLHTRLHSVPELADRAMSLGRQLIDVRTPPPGIPVGTGRKRSGKRLLTVGTDCALGKKYTALTLARGFAARGIAANFRATGQTGILIAGRGMPIDAVVSDFVAGAAEQLSPDAGAAHWDVIEGQGSLFHPAYAGVSLGLLHGSQPDVIVMCHRPGRTEVVGAPGFALPDLTDAIDLNLRLGARTNPAIRCGGISLNTAQLDEAEAEAVMVAEEARLGLPVADPIRGGARLERLIDSCLADAS